MALWLLLILLCHQLLLLLLLLFPAVVVAAACYCCFDNVLREVMLLQQMLWIRQHHLSWWLHWLSVGLVIETSQVQLPAGVLSSQLGQLSFPSLRGRYIEYQHAWLGLRRGVFTCVR